ncbi:MAG: ComF family protein, partial [Erythrobacter sp.]|nr:ComF family protein [Erythrobacter sp.]
MEVNLKPIYGPWADGYVLDKHTLKSVHIGDNEQGYPQFDTTRSEAGEALYQLKYANDYSQAKPLAQAINEHILPHFPKIGLIVPVPPSTKRTRQPVQEIANELAKMIGVEVFTDIVR